MWIWLSIIIALIGTGIITYLITWAFNRRTTRHILSAAWERKERARAEVLDILESHFINEDDVSEELIGQLVRSSRRAYDVNTDDTFYPQAVLEDVQLRFERSRHLDANEKIEYVGRVQELIDSLTVRPQLSLELDYSELEAKLAQAIGKEPAEQAIPVFREFAHMELPNQQLLLRELEYAKMLEQRRKRQIQAQLVLSVMFGILAALATILVMLFR